ncbi:MAG: hypothetical protein EOP11_18840 [Proteobacteria bacterium]|nr:MAG: hypothetical protein EOP11_18840 [Pseudomonadota bacterium]
MRVQVKFAFALLSFLTIAFLPATARADIPGPVVMPAGTVVIPTGPTPIGTTTGSVGPAVSITKNMRAFYEMWLRGMNTQSLSGNVGGTGTSLAINHTFGLGYRINPKWAIGFTQGFTQSIDDKPTAEKDPWIANDPYLALSNVSILKNEAYGLNLFGYVRYYLPISRATRQNADKAAAGEAGNGSLRLYLNPTKTWLDGKLTLNFVLLGQYRLAARSDGDRIAASTKEENGQKVEGNPYRDDFYFIVNPLLAYTLSSTAEVYLEYATGLLNHSTSGALSKLNDPSNGQYVSVGTNLLVGKKLLLNPYLSAGPVFRGVKNTDIGLIASYTFL